MAQFAIVDLSTVSEEAQEAVRRDERRRLASLLTDHRDTLAAFVATPAKMVDTIAFLLRMGDDA